MNGNDIERASPRSGRPGHLLGRARSAGKTSGQALVLVALCMMALIGMVGLAVDGGSMFVQRRTAQNGADGAALAGTKTMLDLFEQRLEENGQVVNGNAGDEAAIFDSMRDSATLGGVITGTLQAFFVNDNKQIVSNIPVGSNGYVPWATGAKGITVKATSQTDAFFMRLFGYNTVSASASATAFMGVATSIIPNLALTPFGFFTDTNALNNMVPGQSYTIMSGDSRYKTDSWGYPSYNGLTSGNSPQASGWLDCGYNPAVRDDTEWARFCPAHAGASSLAGPTQYWTGGAAPTSGPFYEYDFKWLDGWWLQGSVAATDSSCDELASIVTEMTSHNPPLFLIPAFDRSTGSGGNSRLHVANLLLFIIEPAPSSQVDCHVRNSPPNIGEHQTWQIQGIYKQAYVGGSGGMHGDLAHVSLHTVFLEN